MMFVEKNVEKYYRGYLQLLGGDSIVQNMSLEMETTLTSFGSIGNSTVRLQQSISYRFNTFCFRIIISAQVEGKKSTVNGLLTRLMISRIAKT